MRSRLSSFAVLAALASPAWAIEVDGRVNAAEWAGAEHVTDFRLTQPLSHAPARLSRYRRRAAHGILEPDRGRDPRGR